MIMSNLKNRKNKDSSPPLTEEKAWQMIRAEPAVHDAFLLWEGMNIGLSQALWKAIELNCTNLIPALVFLGAPLYGQRFDKTPMHFATTEHNIEAIRYLAAEPRTDVDAQDTWGHTPLHEAAEKGYTEVVHCLVNECGANVNAKDNNGATPLYSAASSYYVKLELIDFLLNIDKVRNHNDCGKSLITKNNQVLQAAINHGNLKMIRQLLAFPEVVKETIVNDNILSKITSYLSSSCPNGARDEETWSRNKTVYATLMEEPALLDHELNHKNSERAQIAQFINVGYNFALWARETKALLAQNGTADKTNDDVIFDLCKKMQDFLPYQDMQLRPIFLTAFKNTKKAIKEKEAKGQNVDDIFLKNSPLFPSP